VPFLILLIKIRKENYKMYLTKVRAWTDSGTIKLEHASLNLLSCVWV